VGSRVRRIAVPVIGLVSIGAASALIAFAPNVLFPPAKEPNARLSAPRASREVARVSAAVVIPVRHGGNPIAAPQATPTSGAPAGGAAIAAASTGRGVGAATAGRQVFRSGGGDKGSEGSSKSKSPKITSKSHGNGKAKGHFKGKSHGKAKGHSKKKHHG
jgi:hypothetical protein